MTNFKISRLCCFLISVILCSLFMTGCASKEKKASGITEEPQAPALFDDWQYKGFGSEYPLWCELVLLEKDISELAQIFPQINGHESDVEILLSYGQDMDMSMHAAQEEGIVELENERELLAKSWVKINPVYEDYAFPYIYIRLYLKHVETDLEEAL